MRPRSRPSPEPHHRNTKERREEISSISSFMICREEEEEEGARCHGDVSRGPVWTVVGTADHIMCPIQHAHVIPGPEALRVADAGFSVVFLQRRLQQDDVELTLQVLQVKVHRVRLEVPTTPTHTVSVVTGPWSCRWR